MIVSFDFINRFEKSNITLCNPDSYLDEQGRIVNSLGTLKNYKNLLVNYNFNSFSDGSFEYSLIDTNLSLIELFEKIVEDRYLFVENFGFVIISNVASGNENNFKTKSISFTTCDKELEFCEAPFLTTNETFTGTIDEVMEKWNSCCPMWSVAYISQNLKSDKHNNKVYRTLDNITSEDAYNFLINEIQDAFDCVVDFDYIKREIYIYSQEEYIIKFQTNIHISKNLLNTLNVEGNYDNSYTALEAVAENELEIRMVNPIGNNIVYNFNHKLDWMPESLREKVREWNTLVQSYKKQYCELSPFWYQAQNDVENTYQDYLVVSENLNNHLMTKRNIEASSDTTEAKQVALEEINKEIIIDYTGGFREFAISRIVVDKIPQNADEWDSEKFYYYVSGIDVEDGNPQWSHIESYSAWETLSKVTPLYTADNLDFGNTKYYKFDGNSYVEISKEDWKQEVLYTYFYGLYEYGDKIGEDYRSKNSWKTHDGYECSVILNALTEKYYFNNKYSYEGLKFKIEDINKQCGLSTQSNIFNDFDLVRLSNYIKVGKYNDSSITVTDTMTYSEVAENAKILMDKTERKLNSIIQNCQKISVDVKSFIFDIAFKNFTDELKSGCIINVEVSEDVFEKIYLTSFSVNYEDKTLSFTLGNKYNKFDIKSLFDEVLGDVSKSTHQIANLKKRVNKLEKQNKNI